MGSYSQYCGISNITIGAGDLCGILPIKKSKNNEIYEYLPCMLPIFGNYDDYGSIENVIKDNNVLFLEKYFDTSIENIIDSILNKEFHTDKLYDYFNDVHYMFINKEVYDFCSSIKSSSEIGNFDLGNKDLLKYLGAKFIKEDNTETRYKFIYELNDKIIKTDGHWIYSNSIYNFKEFYEFYNLDSKYEWLLNVDKFALHQIYGYNYTCQHILTLFDIPIYNVSYYINDLDTYDNISNKMKNNKILLEYFNPNTINLYIEDLIKLKRLQLNIYCFSGFFKPINIYASPQCPEHEEHLIYLNKFIEILKNKI